MNHQELLDHFTKHGQEQIFQFWDQLSEEEKTALTQQAEGINLAEISRLGEKLQDKPEELDVDAIMPAPLIALPKNGGDEQLWSVAKEAGEKALRDGRVAAFTVAGGQGTRLGFDGPKGTFPVTPVLGKSLFQVFAEKIEAASLRYGKEISWYIMTSVINHEDTVEFLETNKYFGLNKDSVHFFQQGLMPAVDDDGKILLSEKGKIAMSPDGHGGSLRALVKSGATLRMEQQGVDIISYFQVDNPLVQSIDPVFIGHHVLAQSELSSKAVPKVSAEEKVGVFCKIDGKTTVVEYSDLPNELMHDTDDEGGLLFSSGSIAIHIFDRDLITRLGEQDSDISMPFHLARKKIPYVNQAGDTIKPDEPNGTKFEMFVFDALPFAENAIVIETAREDDFSPVKNADGVDSAISSKADQQKQFARWFEAVGEEISMKENGVPKPRIEISPLFADTEEAFVEAWNELEDKPVLGEEEIVIELE